MTIPTILSATAAYWHCTPADLIGPSRVGSVALPRHVAMYLAKESGAGVVEIGRAFYRDHSTVIHAVRKIGWLMELDAELARQVEIVRGMVTNISGATAHGA